MKTALETAIDLLAVGLWPIPITSINDPNVIAPGKQPIGKNWGETKHTPESLERIYAQIPDAGVGIKLGPEGGVVDLDVDEPEVGETTLLRIFGGEIPETTGWSSARGRHLLFRWDDRLAKYGKALVKYHAEYPGLELRFGWSAEGKQYQSVIPPSLGTDGKARTWNGVEEILPLPESFFEDLDQNLIAPQKANVTTARRKLTVQTWSAETRAAAYLRKCEPAISGQRGHDKLFKAACKTGPGFNLDPEIAYRLLMEIYNPTCNPPWSEKEVRHKVDEAYKVESRRGWILKEERQQAVEGGDAAEGDNAAEEEAPGESDDDPHRLARLYLSDQANSDGDLTLRYWLEEWHRWDGSHYEVISPSEIRAELIGCIKTEFDRIARERKELSKRVTTGLVANALAACQDLALLSSKECPSQPSWLGFEGEDLPDPREVLPARNGLIHLPALIEGRPAILPPTPLFFSPNTLGYDFFPNAPRPTEWLGFLKTLWPDDQESINCLQEFMGYLLTPDTSQQKMLMIIGPKRSGKGTIARVIRALVGSQNATSPTLSGMATNFGLAPLIGKTLAIFADARLSGRADGQVIVERLLSISGEDAQTIDRKHLSSWTGHLLARFVLISNELPRLGDSSGALPSRMVVLQLTRSFYGNEDTDLTRRLIAELPSILLWAIAGWARLRKRGRFIQPKSSQGMLEDLEELSSPISGFIEERCEVAPGLREEIPRLFKAWKEYCTEKGRDHPGDEQGFGRSIHAAIPSLKTRRKGSDGHRVREYEGIRLK